MPIGPMVLPRFGAARKLSLLVAIVLSLALSACGEEAKPRADQSVCPIDQPLTLSFRIRDAMIDIEKGDWSLVIDAPSNLGCYVGLVTYVGKEFPPTCRNGAKTTVSGEAYCSLCNGDPNYVIFRATEITCG